MIKNKKTSIKPFVRKVRYSKYIASFSRAGGNVHSPKFRLWLKDLQLSKKEIDEIVKMATTGLSPLITHAEWWLKRKRDLKWKHNH